MLSANRRSTSAAHLFIVASLGPSNSISTSHFKCGITPSSASSRSSSPSPSYIDTLSRGHPWIEWKNYDCIKEAVKACEPHDREPRFEVMQFEDDEAVKAFVADKSEHRNLTKAQQAMRLALLYPEPDKGGRGKDGKASETDG